MSDSEKYKQEKQQKLRQNEAVHIAAMVSSPGWAFLDSHINNKINVLESNLLKEKFESSEDAFKIKGMLHELKAYKGLLAYINVRLERARGGN